jgi:flagellar basal-body rod modification protein FlgD
METGISSQVATTEFLTLLTIQLQNQDPIDPVKQEDFIGQLSQFSMLEGVETLNTSFESMLKLQEISQGIDLVGKHVDYLDVESGEIKTGRIDELFVDQGLVNLMINGNPISVDLIAGVKADKTTLSDTPSN